MDNRVIPIANNESLASKRTHIAISIIIVNYNGRNDLARCLDSLINTSNPAQEIILVDNASTDDSVELVKSNFPSVRVISNSINGGFGQGNNLGVNTAKGEFLIFLNPDTIVTHGWQDALIRTLESDPQIGMVTSQIRLMDGTERINTCGNDIHCTGLTLCRGMGKEAHTYNRLEDVCAVSGAAFTMRKTLFDALGGFDESFFMYMEDTDLSLRVRQMGYRVVCVPDSVVYHDYSLTFNPRKTFYQERNRYLMFLKTLRWRTLLLLTPVFLLAEIITWSFSFIRDRRNLANKLWAYGWIISHWRQIMENREGVQSLRTMRDWDLIESFTHKLEFEQTGDSLLTRSAHIAFDPLFFILHRLSLWIIWW